jgi:hypothetical protein
MMYLVIITAGVANRIAPTIQIPILKGRFKIAGGRVIEPNTSAMEGVYGRNAEMRKTNPITNEPTPSDSR